VVKTPRTVAVGVFDGVHVGHRTLLRGADAAVTFSVHPLGVLSPGAAPRLLMRLEERLAAIRGEGVGDIRVLPFTPELAAMEPEAFLARHLEGFSRIRCGENWRFGRGGRGTPETARALGWRVDVVPYAVFGGARVSSTRVRETLAAGDLPATAAMLGRPWSLAARAVSGKGVGRAIGFPTLNLAPCGADVLALPPTGVYAVSLDGRRGVANWGFAPTFADRAWKEPVLEVHLLDGVPDAGDGVRTVAFLARLRDERTFASVDELAAQIASDCARARLIAP
jgi:riboflavin kinase/FMN adenylyltransferase